MVRLTILIFPLYSVLLAPSGLLRKTDEKYGNLIIHLSGNPVIYLSLSFASVFHKGFHIL